MGEVLYEGVTVKYSDAYSFQVYGATNVDIPDGTVVYCSNFSHESLDTPFRTDMKDVTFVNCNLDNCVVSPNNTVVGGTQRTFLVQADGNDWEVDGGRPTRILNAWVFAKFGVREPHPDEIPTERVVERIDWLQLFLMERGR